jgi:hypothetical protein
MACVAAASALLAPGGAATGGVSYPDDLNRFIDRRDTGFQLTCHISDNLVSVKDNNEDELFLQTSSFSDTEFIANRTDSCTGQGWLFFQRLRVREERKVRE